MYLSEEADNLKQYTESPAYINPEAIDKGVAYATRIASGERPWWPAVSWPCKSDKRRGYPNLTFNVAGQTTQQNTKGLRFGKGKYANAAQVPTYGITLLDFPALEKGEKLTKRQKTMISTMVRHELGHGAETRRILRRIATHPTWSSAEKRQKKSSFLRPPHSRKKRSSMEELVAAAKKYSHDFHDPKGKRANNAWHAKRKRAIGTADYASKEAKVYLRDNPQSDTMKQYNAAYVKNLHAALSALAHDGKALEFAAVISSLQPAYHTYVKATKRLPKWDVLLKKTANDHFYKTWKELPSLIGLFHKKMKEAGMPLAPLDKETAKRVRASAKRRKATALANIAKKKKTKGKK